MTKGKGKKSYRVHTRGGFNTFAAWKHASQFMKRMADNGETEIRLEVIHGDG